MTEELINKEKSNMPENKLQKNPYDDFPVIPMKPGGRKMTLKIVNKSRDEEE